MTKKIFKYLLAAIVLNLLISSVAGAYSIDPSYRPVNSPFDLNYDRSTPAFNTVIILQILAGALLYFAAPVAIIMIVKSGLSMVQGGAESETLETGKKGLTWSVIGLVVVILSYSLVRFVITLIVNAGSAVSTT